MDNYITLEHLDQTVWSLIQKNSQLRDEISAVDEKINNIKIEESDPVFSASPAAHITDNDIDYWYSAVRSSDLNYYMKKGVDRVTAGQNTGTSVGAYATAEGQYNNAYGTYSHAEGNYTNATGLAAHAEGVNTKASGNYSHAEGYYTTAQKDYQHVFGSANILDTGSEPKGSYIEIVGNGASNTKRSNARTLDWSGNEWLAGKLTVGAEPTDDMDVATKQYVDTAIPTVPTKTSELTNDSGFLTSVRSINHLQSRSTNPTEKVYLIGTPQVYEVGTSAYYFKHMGPNFSIAYQTNNGHILTIGRSIGTASTSIDYQGGLELYNSGQFSTLLLPTQDTHSTQNIIRLPNASGTLALTSQLPTKTSQLTNDSGYITSAPVTSVNGKTGTVNLDNSYVKQQQTSGVYSSNIRNKGVSIEIDSQSSGDTDIRKNNIAISSQVATSIKLQSSYQQTPTSDRKYSPYIELITGYGDSHHNLIEMGYVINEDVDYPQVISMIALNCTTKQTFIRDLVTPTVDTDAANKLYVDTTVANAISNVTGGFNASIVTTLPTTDIDTHTIYFMSKTGSTNDVYDEYMYINNAWEKIGNTAVDLSGYLRSTDIAAWAKASTKPKYSISEIVGGIEEIAKVITVVNGADVQYALSIKSYDDYYEIPIYKTSPQSDLDIVTKDYVDTAISGITIPTKVSDLTNDAGYLTSYTETDPTVPAWAKAANKPTYTAAEVGALPDTTVITDEKLKIVATSDMDTYYPIISTNSTVASTKLFNTDFKYTISTAFSTLEIGTGTNKIGRLILRDGDLNIVLKPGTYSGDITSSATINLPMMSGTMALTSDIPTKLSDLTNDAGYITSYTETDPVFAASAAAGITSTDISNWNAKVSDDKTWNGVTLDKTQSSGAAAGYVCYVTSTDATSAKYYPVSSSNATSANAIPKYDSVGRLRAVTLTAGDNSTYVATTAYVTTAISNIDIPALEPVANVEAMLTSLGLSINTNLTAAAAGTAETGHAVVQEG